MFNLLCITYKNGYFCDHLCQPCIQWIEIREVQGVIQLSSVEISLAIILELVPEDLGKKCMKNECEYSRTVISSARSRHHAGFAPNIMAIEMTIITILSGVSFLYRDLLNSFLCSLRLSFFSSRELTSTHDGVSELFCHEQRRRVRSLESHALVHLRGSSAAAVRVVAVPVSLWKE